MTQKEKAYRFIINTAVSLYNKNKKLRDDQLLAIVNEHFPNNTYGNLRSVYHACWIRASDEEKEALEMSFTDKNGKPLLEVSSQHCDVENDKIKI